MSDDDITMLGEILEKRDMAIRFRPRGLPFCIWLPKSQIAIIHGKNGPEVTMPIWLAEKKKIL